MIPDYLASALPECPHEPVPDLFCFSWVGFKATYRNQQLCGVPIEEDIVKVVSIIILGFHES